MSRNRRKMAKIVHNAAKKFDWVMGWCNLMEIPQFYLPIRSTDIQYSNSGIFFPKFVSYL